MSSEAIALKLDQAVAEGSSLTRGTLKSTFSGAIAVARVAKQIRDALTPEMVKEIVLIQETDFGWRTDGKNYTLEQIRDAWVDAALKGAVPVNNEVNIISGRAYLCKNYFTRMIREYPGLTEFVAIPGKVQMLPTGALVDYTATWKLNGKAMQLARTGPSAIPVRLNAGMGVDGALGKAERKLKAGVFSMITGSTFDDDSDDFVDEVKPPTITVTPKEPNMPQNVLPEPTKEKAGTTQTKATTEKIKKDKKIEPAPTPSAPPATEQQTQQSEPQEQGAADDGDKAPWETGNDDEPPVTEEQQSEPAPAPTPQPAQSAPAAAQATAKKDKPKPEEKKPDPVKEDPKQDAAGSGVIERDNIGTIARVAATVIGKEKKAPYWIISNNGTKYYTNDVEVAKKAKEYQGKPADNNGPGTPAVPISIDYAVGEDKNYWIVDLIPEGSDSNSDM